MSRKECPACGTSLREISDWIDACSACNYMCSRLTPGGGAALGEGFEDLRRKNFEVLLDHLSRHKILRNARLLEVGCGRGWFLEAAQHRGMIVSGIEPGPDIDAARKRGFNVDAGFFPQDLSKQGPFDVISFNDVFEHIPEPSAAIIAVERLLAEGGILVLNLPSSDGIFFRTAEILNRLGWHGPYDRLWQRGLGSPHISYFNSTNLVAFVRRQTALKLIEQSSLRSISRDGLRERIKITIPTWRGDLMFVAVWFASFGLWMLPADIALMMFRKEPLR